MSAGGEWKVESKFSQQYYIKKAEFERFMNKAKTK